MLGQIDTAGLTREHEPASCESPSGMGGDQTSSFLPIMHSLEDPQANHVYNNLEEVHNIHLTPVTAENDLVETPKITWPLPEAQVLPFNPVQTDADTEAFPDYPNPANNLILARTALLEQLNSTTDKEAYPKLRPRRPFDAIHSRVVSHTGHIKEHENLNRSKVALTSALSAIEKGRQDRALGNKRKLLAERHLYANAVRNSKSTQPREELRKILKTRLEKGVRDAFSYEREHGWDVVMEQPSIGEFRDFHDPYWQLRMTSELQPGTELTRSVITALLMLKQTFPLQYLTININPAAVALGLNGYPRPISRASGFKTKKFKPSRLLGLPCNADTSSRRSSLSSNTESSSPAPATRSTGMALKARTVTLMRRVKLTVRRLSKKKNLAIAQKLSTSPDVVEPRPESDYEDSDDEYADAAEFLKQEDQNKDKVSHWLAVNFDGTPPADPSLVALGPGEPGEMPSPRTATSTFSVEEAILATLPSSSSAVSSSIPHHQKNTDSAAAGAVESGNKFSLFSPISTFSPSSPVSSSISYHHKNADSPAAGTVGSGNKLAVFSPISTFSPFETSSESHPPSDNGSDQDQQLESSSITDVVAVIETVAFQKPISSARMVSIRKVTKDLKHQLSVLSQSKATKSDSHHHERVPSIPALTSDDGASSLQTTTTPPNPAISSIGQPEETLTKKTSEAPLTTAHPVSSPRQALHRAAKKGDLRDMADAETAAEFEASPSAVASTHAFHGGLVSGSLPLVADAAVNASPSLSASLRLSQRQREFLHRRYHQGQGQDQSQSRSQSQGQVQGQIKDDKTRRKSRGGGLFQKLTRG